MIQKLVSTVVFVGVAVVLCVAFLALGGSDPQTHSSFYTEVSAKEVLVATPRVTSPVKKPSPPVAKKVNLSPTWNPNPLGNSIIDYSRPRPSY